ncbi:MAG: exodeoxyribonuclease VII small subunit [Planctomycetes bacterium]|nr:exodeoxyribonuclease VII small subunit [Planctomycetota bacterium]
MAARKKSQFVYSEASTELETILDEIETGDADIDVLSDKVERAATLIRDCREALEGTELRVRKVVEELTKDADESDED